MTVQIETLFAIAVPLLIGAGVSWLTAFVTKEHLPSWATILVNAVLAALGGAVQAVAFIATGHLRNDVLTWVGLIAFTWVGNVIAYLQGGPKKLALATWNFGIGRKINVDELGWMGKYAMDDQSGQPE